MWVLIETTAGVDTWECQDNGKPDLGLPADIKAKNVSPPYEINGLWRVDVVRPENSTIS